jgi:thymidylate kinase
MDRWFIVVSGLPGSGKSTLARELASASGLNLLDKDTILERLFDSKGTGDAEWRRALSRESDQILQAEATASKGAILVSHWHLPGMPSTSGTPTNWLLKLSARLFNVHCECETEVAIERFLRRKRHSGHLDNQRSHAEIRESIRDVASLGRLNIGPCVLVDTSQPPNLNLVLDEVRRALE